VLTCASVRHTRRCSYVPAVGELFDATIAVSPHQRGRAEGQAEVAAATAAATAATSSSIVGEGEYRGDTSTGSVGGGGAQERASSVDDQVDTLASRLAARLAEFELQPAPIISALGSRALRADPSAEALPPPPNALIQDGSGDINIRARAHGQVVPSSDASEGLCPDLDESASSSEFDSSDTDDDPGSSGGQGGGHLFGRHRTPRADSSSSGSGSSFSSSLDDDFDLDSASGSEE
jgi:hypothetical protein